MSDLAAGCQSGLMGRIANPFVAGSNPAPACATLQTPQDSTIPLPRIIPSYPCP